ncbi:MAG: carbon starvation protein A [Clostridium sp.]|nr:carbon starvation protein A [Prevotella sp.]MCM1428981.1 carbon starvation protein A [Clostridium sp.]MCM1475489.1 carbon starvation protein A [Muribaculaceae bacterium]
MTAFLISLAVLIVGYFVYGKFVDRLLDTDSKRPMPCDTLRDDIDYKPLPTWKVFLIQFLNIAGLGPIFGAIMGVMFGPASFLWIALGTIFAGGVHDLCSGTISIRMGGKSLPEIIGSQLGRGVMQFVRGFTVLLLILVAAVFVVSPAGVLASMTPDYLNVTFWLVVIFAYYILATLLPIDKVIGNIYPVFGFALLFMAAGIMGVLLFGEASIPVDFGSGFGSHNPHGLPVFPMMFVSIACGAISGFHATQSPMMARCLKNEKLARPVFYGAMVAEGVVALVWAAAAVTFTGSYEALADYMAVEGHSTATLVNDVSFGWLSTFGGVLALLGVVAAPITTGDTALRSARLSVADIFGIEQKKIWPRLAVAIPIFVLTAVIMMVDFNTLWRYFAWCNQTLSVFTLWAVTLWLARRGKMYLVTMIPALFMTAVCTSYILAAPQPEGVGLPQEVAIGIGLTAAAIAGGWFMIAKRRLELIPSEEPIKLDKMQ